MLMSYNELIDEVVRCRYLQGVDVENVNASSIDVRLGDTFLIEMPTPSGCAPRAVDLKRKEDCLWHAPVPLEHSYRTKGQYNGDSSVSANKGLR